MALQFQNVSVPFAQGLDTKTDEKLVVPGKLVDLQNGVFTEGNKIRKRFGWSELNDADLITGTEFTSARALSTYKDELNEFTNNSLYTYSLTNDAWISKGDLVSVKITTQSVIDSNDEQSQQDLSCNTNVLVTAWKDSRGGVRASVVDTQTGSEYITDLELSSSGERPRVITSQNFIFVFYRDGANLVYRRLNTFVPNTFQAQKTVKTDINTTNINYDITILGSNILVTYNDTSNEVHLFYWVTTTEVVGTAALGLGDEFTATGEDGENCLGIYVLDPETNDPTIMVAYHNDASGVRVFGRQKDLTIRFAAATLDSAIMTKVDTFVDGDVTVGTDNINVASHPFTSNDRIQLTTSGTLPAGLSLATDYYVIIVDSDNIKLSTEFGPGSAVDITAAAGGGTHTITFQDPEIVNITGIESATDTVNWYYEDKRLQADNHSVRQNTVTKAGVIGTASVFIRSVGLGTKAFLVDTDPYVGIVHDSTLQSTYFIVNENGNTIARIHPLQAGGLTDVPFLPQVQLVSTDLYEFASLIKGRLQLEDSTFFNREGVSRTQINFSTQDTYAFDELGESLFVSGGQIFQYDGAQVGEYGFHIFPENLSSVSATTGGSMSDGTYGFRAVYEWVDSQGQRHRSAPSPTITVVVSGGGSSQTVTVTVSTLRVTSKDRVTIHLYSTEAAGTISHRVTSVSAPTFNDTTIDSVEITRTDDDATLIGNEILYTTGGVVGNIAPPNAHIITSHQNRMYLSGIENENEIWFSKEFIEGEGVAFSDLFIRRVEQEGGKITQLASLDDKLIIFKESRIYFQTGRGPAITGAQNDFTEPQLITTDVGCTEPKSVVLMPDGLMFKSDKGIYLLDLSARVSYVGAEVELFNDEIITSGVLLDKVNEVRFTTETSRTLVYNYFYKSVNEITGQKEVGQWSTFTNYEAISAVNWQSTHTHLKSTGMVRREIEDQFVDMGATINLIIETAWLKMAGLQGFQRVRRMALLGEFESNHKLQTSVFYDYEDFFRSLIIFNATGVINDPLYGDDVTYGDSAVYGGDAAGDNNVYQFRAHMPRQKCQSIKFRFEDQISGNDAGESFSLSDLTLEVGMKRGINKLPSDKTL